MAKPPKTPTLDLNEPNPAATEQASAAPAAGDGTTDTDATAEHADAIAALASGSTLEAAVEQVPVVTPVLADKDIPTGNPGVNAVDTPAEPMAAYFQQQAIELGKQNQALAVEKALLQRDLEAATVKASEHAELLSGLTQAAQAAINLRTIQMGGSSANLTHLTPQGTLAEFTRVHNAFLSTFAAGRHSSGEPDDPAAANVVPGPIPGGDAVRKAVRV
jgi:hypothetical protein